MIRLNTNIQLDNGAIATHYILAIVSVSTQKIDLTLDGFVSSEIANNAMTKFNLERRQKELIENFNELVQKENPTEEEQSTLTNYQQEINELASQIANSKEYSEFVVDCDFVSIPYTDKITEEYLLQEILKLDKYKNSTEYSI